jgi:hypothetical protein
MKPINPEVVKAQIAGLLVRHPELQDDEEALQLSLDSETDATALLGQIVAKLQESKALSNGTANWISDLRARQDRYDRRQEALRALAFRIMEIAGLKKLELPLATLAIAAGRPKVVITDAAALPAVYVRTVREPAKVLIADTIKSGHAVPGAELSNAEPVLSIHVK